MHRNAEDLASGGPWDLLVVGSGGGGLQAATVAASGGARVLLIEQTGHVGGTYAYSAGIVWAPANSFALVDGVVDSLEAARAHITHLSGGRHEPPVLDAYVSRIPGILDALARRGVPLEWVPGIADYYADAPGGLHEGRYVGGPVFEPAMLPAAWRDRIVTSPYYSTVPTSWREVQTWGGYGAIGNWDWELLEARRARGCVGFGMASIGYLLVAALSAGVTIVLDTAMVDLAREDGGVVGATVRHGGREAVVLARLGVILAAGGYDHDAELQRCFDPHPPVRAVTNPGVDGSVVRAAMAAGGVIRNVGGQFLAPVIEPLAPASHDAQDGPRAVPVNKEIGLPGALVVNRRGRRFADDSFYIALARAMATLDRSTLQYENRPAWLIVDGEWMDRYSHRFPMLSPDDERWVCRGETVEALAGRLEIPPPDLEEAIAVFNGDASRGVDLAFGRGTNSYVRTRSDGRVERNPCLRPLQAPYFAVRLDVGSMGTLSGLAVDEHARVQTSAGQAITGLYACGGTMANLVGGEFYNSGLANGLGIAFGAIAAEHAVTRGA